MLEAPPGAPPFPDNLATRLKDAVVAKGPGYAPRTHHLVDGRPRFTNRLILETSPYLLQHAHNPVSWYPWGKEAFDDARRLGRPVLLSVGYATCHWCHVMEAESFEDLEIARVMNERCVCIKVDREERPDVDAIYMSAVQQLTGHGGWPMTVFLTSDQKPFFGGTYFPARDGDRGTGRGFLSLLRELAGVYRDDPKRIAEASEALASAVRDDLVDLGARLDRPLPGERVIAATAEYFEKAFDPVYGGVQRAPKFPSNMPIRLLLRHHRRSGDAEALRIATVTLEKMATGGLYDQLAGGFHRYATDEAWRVPHFEKMLYDNALLVVAYAEAFQVTRRADFARVARETLDYLMREMTAPGGAFYSATDADSEGVEGRFFVWSEEEIREALGAEAERFIRFYGVTRQGNFEGQNILHVAAPDEAEQAALAGARAKLYAARSQRIPPLRDDKILAAWNGLAISAFAFGGRILREPKYLEAGARAAGFVLDPMHPGDRLLRSFKDGRARHNGYLEDYAFVIQGLLDLYESTFEPRWLEAALTLAEEMDACFADRERGGWFMTRDDHETLIAREKPNRDGAEPSGASVALLDVLRLAEFTGEARWSKAGRIALEAFAGQLMERPLALTEMLLAIDFTCDVPKEVVLVWRQGEALPAPFAEVLAKTFVPNRVIAGAAEGEPLSKLARLVPLAQGKGTMDGKATAYVCQRGTCQLPSQDPAELERKLRELSRPAPR